MWALNAIGSASTFWLKEGQIKSWMDSIELSGRPTLDEILSQKQSCEDNWRKFAAMLRESRNLQNICDQLQVQKMMKLIYRVRTRLNSITNRFRRLEIHFKETEINSAKNELLPMLEAKQTERFRELEAKVMSRKVLVCI